MNIPIRLAKVLDIEQEKFKFVIFQIMRIEEVLDFNNKNIIKLMTSYNEDIEQIKLENFETNLVYKCNNING